MRLGAYGPRGEVREVAVSCFVEYRKEDSTEVAPLPMKTPRPFFRRESMLHLAKRFFSTLFARGLTAEERAFVADTLEDAELVALFHRQQRGEQRHTVEAAKFVAAQGGDVTLIRAALLHDVGKCLIRIGVIGRTLATLAKKLSLPTPPRWTAYLNHGEAGAALLRDHGCPAWMVDFVAHHHENVRPESVVPEAWDLLKDADG